jgi:hypothetical protein
LFDSLGFRSNSCLCPVRDVGYASRLWWVSALFSASSVVVILGEVTLLRIFSSNPELYSRR